MCFCFETVMEAPKTSKKEEKYNSSICDDVRNATEWKFEMTMYEIVRNRLCSAQENYRWISPLLFRKTNGNRLNLAEAFFAHHNNSYALKLPNCHLLSLTKCEKQIDNIPQQNIQMQCAGVTNWTLTMKMWLPLPAITKTLRRHCTSIWHCARA